MDREKAIRAAYFAALDGNLTYDGSPVKVFDQKFEPNTNDIQYVLFSNQSSQNESNFSCYKWKSRIVLQVVSKTQSAVSSDVVDDIGELIEGIMLPGTPPQNGLVAQTGWQILNVELESVAYSTFQITETNSVISKLLTFSQTITKT